MDMSKYLKLFLSEAAEHLQKMDNFLLELEKSPQDKSLVDQLFREAHSMKGMSASMGFRHISSLSHRLEDFLDRIRKGNISPSQSAIDLLFEGLDRLRNSIEQVREGGSDALDHSSFTGRLESYSGEPQSSAPPSPQPPAPTPAAALVSPGPLVLEEEMMRQAQEWAAEKGLHLYWVAVQVARDSAMPNARALVICKRVAGMGEILAMSPTLEELQGGNFAGVLSLLLASTKEASEIRTTIQTQPEIASVSVQAAEDREGAATPPVMREAVVIGKEGPAAAASAVPLQMRKSTMVRVDTRLLDDLIDTVGELITAKGSLTDHLPSLTMTRLREDINRVDSLVSSLYQLAIRLRMMPLDFVAERFPRAIRDLARAKGKEVEFEIIGKEVELDRAILEELPDPLLHIFRNCIDHGIEPPEERIRRGKPTRGKIRMEASRERERILIRISDDGQGMDPERIKKIALEKGIINRERYESLSPGEALYLITAPGFTTAEVVSEVSGRGVGMDVVRSVIESLGGTLLVESQKGVGTTIILKLPLTLAIIQVLLVRVGEERYAVPLSQVYRTLEVSPGEIQVSQGQEWIASEEGLIPLFRLASVLGGADGKGFPGGTLSGILVERRGRMAGMIVDELLGYREAVLKPLKGVLKGIKGFSGATIMGDGSLVLVLDLNTL